jgi:hypothetical protein
MLGDMFAEEGADYEDVGATTAVYTASYKGKAPL